MFESILLSLARIILPFYSAIMLIVSLSNKVFAKGGEGEVGEGLEAESWLEESETHSGRMHLTPLQPPSVYSSTSKLAKRSH